MNYSTDDYSGNAVVRRRSRSKQGGQKTSYGGHNGYNGHNEYNEYKKSMKGGTVVDDIKNLAVPFAILLAKQGIQTFFQNKSGDVGIAASPKKSVQNANNSITASARPSASKSAQQTGKGLTVPKVPKRGGSCSACQASTSMTGGSKQDASALKKNYESLAKKIDDFLSKY